MEHEQGSARIEQMLGLSPGSLDAAGQCAALRATPVGGQRVDAARSRIERQLGLSAGTLGAVATGDRPAFQTALHAAMDAEVFDQGLRRGTGRACDTAGRAAAATQLTALQLAALAAAAQQLDNIGDQVDGMQARLAAACRRLGLPAGDRAAALAGIRPPTGYRG